MLVSVRLLTFNESASLPLVVPAIRRALAGASEASLGPALAYPEQLRALKRNQRA